ncbi:MAG: DUF3604 domain-containing protein [Spirochaetia bacterium]
MYRFSYAGALSNPVRVEEGVNGPYWGDIHIHSKLSHDAQGNDPFSYARDVSGLDFAGLADHWDSIGPEGYAVLERWLEEADAEGEFVTIPGDERNPEKLTGHHNIYFRDREYFRENQVFPGEGQKSDPAGEARELRNMDPERVMLIPHHTGIVFGKLPERGIGAAVDLEAWDDPGLRPVMEIYSHHGQSELYSPAHFYAYEFNRMRRPERRSNTSVPGPYYARDYWKAGHRMGVISSSDEHSGQGGRRHGGIAAVFADRLNRESVFDGIRNRRCYGTTGERILLDFSVDGLGMGQEGVRRKGAELPVRLKVWATEILLRVEILRYRPERDNDFIPIISEPPRPERMDYEIELMDVPDGPAVYYARIIQEPLSRPGMAWSSPVWIS